MCGRYSLTNTEGLVDEFDLVEAPRLAPRYNIAPTQPVPIIANRGERRVEEAHWGLIPVWADDPGIGTRMINARAESLAAKPAFRDAYARRRCLVLADGFFEWKREGKKKIPHWYHRADGRPFAFAGLWERWREGEGEEDRDEDAPWLISCTIITCPPNELAGALHDRMPVIVERESYERWLCPEPLTPDALADMLRAPPPEGFELTRVSTRVNKVEHDDPACVEPDEPRQQTLF